MAQIQATMQKDCARFPPITLSTGNFSPDNNPINQIQKLDSVHDFGGTRGNNLATDSINKNRATSNYAYNQMRLSFIQKYSFPEESDLGRQITPISIQQYSNFSFPGAGQIPRIVDDVENFVLLSALQDAINRGLTEADNFLCIPTNPLTFADTKMRLATFFIGYIDKTGTGKINFIVDTPGNLTKVLRSNKDQKSFAYVLTQESAHDSAKGKPTTLSPIVIDEAYNGNGFCEAFGVQVNPHRDYKFTAANFNDPGTFESNFTITFNGMKYTKVNKEFFSTDVNYNKTGFNQDVSCPLNGLVHPTNVPQITKAVTELTKVSDLILNQSDKDILDQHAAADYINRFYTAFTTPLDKYNYSEENQKLLDFNFTKKRAGDGLQARICQYINSGTIQLNCYKRSIPSVDPVGNVAAGLFTGKVYSITKLILVTIDRVLFSYCVKNDIPAIYSGTEFFLFFRPELPPNPPPPNPPPQNAGTVFNRIGGMSLLPPHIKTYSNKSARNQIIKSVKRGGIFQKGGDHDNVDVFYDVINDIPYIIFKLLPRILNNYKGARIVLLPRAINLFKSIRDEDITTYYDDKMPILIYVDKLQTLSNELSPPVTDKTIIYLRKENIDCKIDRITGQGRSADYQFSTHNINAITFSKSDITQIIGNVIGVITKSKLNALAQEIDLSVLLDFNLSYFSIDDAPEDDAPQDAGKNQRGGDKKSLLDLYTINMVSSENLLNNDKIKEENLIALLSYINIFTCYEVSFCYDNEIYAQKFNNINGLEVTNNIGLYIMFDLLLKDFSEQKSKISYSLLEYFINSGDSSQKYLSISTDMMEILQYVYCDDVRLDESLNRKIEKQMQGQIISTGNPIFVESQTYYSTLFDRIATKQSEVQAYLDGTNVEPNIRNYITNNLSMYGFMNMVNDVVDSLLPAYPSGEERRQQIESQRNRFKSRKPINPEQSQASGLQAAYPSEEERRQQIESQQQRKTGIVTLPDLQKNQKNRKNLGQAIQVYAKSFGGKYRTNKNNRKNRKTRKNIKIIKKTRNIRKTKKQIIKRTRRH